jgi:anti-sigma B factor antagonist
MVEFEVDAKAVGPHAIVVVRGELDAYTAPRLRETFVDLVAAGVDRLVVDLRQVTFIDSTGLGTLVATRKRLRVADKNLCIVLGEDQAAVRRPFEITGLARVFPIHPTVEAAVHDCLEEPAA